MSMEDQLNAQSSGDDQTSSEPQATAGKSAAEEGAGTEDWKTRYDQLRAQNSTLQQAHERTLNEVKQLKQQGVDVTSVKQALDEMRTELDANRAEQVSIQINSLLSSGDDDGAKSVAERDIKRRISRMGLDIKTDPRLKALRTDDPLEAHRALNVLEPVLRIMPVEKPVATTSANAVPKVEVKLPASEPKIETKSADVHKIAKHTPTGGDDANSLSPIEQIKRGLENRNKGG